MATTPFPQDKYAFLFTGPTSANFVKDVEDVFEALTEYYNYPPGNVTVVRGSTAALPNVPGATLITITSVADLQTALTNFAATASGPTASGDSTTALLYFTGGGVIETSVSKLVIDDDPTGTNNVDPPWMQARLNAFTACHVEVVMQQSFSGGFLSALTGSVLPQWSFTHASSAIQDAYGNNALGSFFTHGWVRGLKLEPLPAGTLNPGQYADQLGSAAQATNRLVSLGEAMDFGKQIHDQLGYGALSTPGYSEGGGPQYLGEPSFLIRDSSYPPAWWESPDIYLTHPNHPWVPPGDLYIPDLPGAISPFNNTINIVTRNMGTHPVRAYSLGIELFKSGMGAVNEQRTECDIIPAATLLLPIDPADIGTPSDQTDTFQWNTAFTQGLTHECIKAEAKRLCGNVDFVWSVPANDFEGQRNTDEMTIVPPPPLPGPQPLPDMRGLKEHIFGLHNRFDTRRRFILLFPDVLQEFEEVLDLTWFAGLREGQAEVNRLDVVQEPVPHIAFDLKAGEATDILLRVEMKPDFDVDGNIRLPFEILVEGDWGTNVRATAFAAVLPNFAPIGGFTVIVNRGAATLKGQVLDAEGQPATEARVFVRTVNDRQGAVLTTAADGHYALPDINPDVYRVWAEAGTWRSKEQIVVLLTGTEAVADLPLTEAIPIDGSRVKVILDKIRIMDDQDPLCKREGELVFTAVVVPDDDAPRKQVTRLPASGVYKVSDKPGENDVSIGATLFDGVVKDRSLSITISGKEIDLFDPDDELNRYHRKFFGAPETWYGQYYPADEYLDREDVGDWALWYRIVAE